MKSRRVKKPCQFLRTATGVFALSSSGGSLSTGFRPVANCSSFIVFSVSIMLRATWSTSLLMNSGSWRLTAISLNERILFSRRSISALDQLVVLAGLFQVGQPRAARLQVVLQRRAEPLRGGIAAVGRQLLELLLQLGNALLDLVARWSS